MPGLLDKLKKGKSGGGAAAGSGSAGSPAAPPSKTKKVGDPSTPCPKKRKKKEKVVKIKATILPTRSLHPPKRLVKETKKLKESASSDESLGGNKPAVLVRGCNPITLTAETAPANRQVRWEIKANQNDNDPPSYTELKRNKIQVETGNTGSYSVIAHLDDSKIVWNVVFVWVKVDAKSTKVKHVESFAKGQTSASATSTSCAAGNFSRGVNAMEATVSVTLIGGDKDGKLGVDRIKLGFLQDGTNDSLTGTYNSKKGGGIGQETVVLPGTKTPAPFPIIDAQGPPAAGDEPHVPADEGGEMSPISVTDVRIIQVKAKGKAKKGKKFEFWFGDSPVGGFARQHPNTGAFLTAISGKNEFRAAVGSYSLDAPQAVCAHADILWSEDFSGTVKPPPAKTGAFKPAPGKHITSGKKFTLIADGTGGSDAFEAGFELFAPRFNHSLITKFTP